MMHKAWCSIGEVPYYLSGSNIKFQCHTSWKIDDLNPIWVRLLGRSQLSNPSDLPCFESSFRFSGRFFGWCEIGHLIGWWWWFKSAIFMMMMMMITMTMWMWMWIYNARIYQAHCCSMRKINQCIPWLNSSHALCKWDTIKWVFSFTLKLSTVLTFFTLWWRLLYDPAVRFWSLFGDFSREPVWYGQCGIHVIKCM